MGLAATLIAVTTWAAGQLWYLRVVARNADASSSLQVEVSPSELLISGHRGEPTPRPLPRLGFNALRDYRLDRMGTGWSPSIRATPFGGWYAVIPHWQVVGIAAFATGAMMWRSRCRGAGACVNCGYDLSSSKRGCPECGWGRGE